ncbi:MAG: hypothetical protein ACLPUT_16905 [Solirubrobacteraceae bacterium]
MIAPLVVVAALVCVAATPAASAAGLESGNGHPVKLMNAKQAEELKNRPQPLLCEYEKCGSMSALEWATLWADDFWGTPVEGQYCTGPYGNGHTHKETQWACYGYDWNYGGFHWQINVDPWGEWTYHNP